MLSVRSLKKLNQKKSNPNAPKGDALKIDGRKQSSIIAGKNDEAGASSSLPDNSEEQPARRKSLRFGSVEEVGGTAGPRCPSPQDVWDSIVNVVYEAKQQGAHYLVVALLCLYVAVYVLRAMTDYLISILNVDVPSGHMMAETIFDFADAHPILFLSLNFGLAIFIGAVFLYLKELQELARQMQQSLRARALNAYQPLDEDGASAAPGGGGGDAQNRFPAGSAGASAAAAAGLPTLDIEAADRSNPSPLTDRSEASFASEGTLTYRERKQTFDDMTRELRLVTDKCEEFEIKTRVIFRKSSAPGAAEAKAELKALQAQRDELRALVAGMSGTDLKKAPASKPTLLGKVIKSALFQILARSANGAGQLFLACST